MNRFKAFVPGTGSVARMLCVGAAAVCAAAVNIGLLGLFHQSSTDPWVAATPQVLQAKAACDAQVERRARDDCTRELVARVASGRAQRLALTPAP